MDLPRVGAIIIAEAHDDRNYPAGDGYRHSLIEIAAARRLLWARVRERHRPARTRAMQRLRGLRRAWLDNLVIVVREQRLTDDDLTAFSARFGVLDEVPPVSKGQVPRYSKHVSVISNIIENGVPIGALGDDEVIWHSDTSYRDEPPVASYLHALEIPPAGGTLVFPRASRARDAAAGAARPHRYAERQERHDFTTRAGNCAKASSPSRTCAPVRGRRIRWCAPTPTRGAIPCISAGGATPMSTVLK